MVIAIDGPAGSGKSTTAKYVAENLGFIHINTGAMYRGISLKCIKGNINSDRIKIRSTAEVEGVLNQKNLSIEEGAALKIKTETYK